MQNTITTKLQEVATTRHEEPGQIIAEAIEIGLGKMWADGVLAQYLHNRISRRKAIQLVGFDLVRLAEHQDSMAQNDIKWGMMNETNRN